MSDRMSWEQYWMVLAYTVAKRATCPRASVGALLVRDNHLLACGYNGSPKNAPHCLDAGCMIIGGHCVRSVHSEANAIVQAALHGVSTKGATLYVTHSPCFACAKLLVNAGITRIVYGETYRVSQDTVDLFAGAGIEATQYQVAS